MLAFLMFTIFVAEVMDSFNGCNVSWICRHCGLSSRAQESRLSTAQFGAYGFLVYEQGCVTHFQVGAQCIHLAAKSGSLATLQLMISYGADVNAKTDPQLLQTPLHLAASSPTPEMCQMLLTNGADPMARDAVRARVKILTIFCSFSC